MKNLVRRHLIAGILAIILIIISSKNFNKIYRKVNSSTKASSTKSEKSQPDDVKTIRRPPCPKFPNMQGPDGSFSDLLKYSEASSKYDVPQEGGSYVPKGCESNYSVSIIVPYRNRKSHLKIFADWMHFFLQMQFVQYRIYIIEQSDNKTFNRAKLMNVGYVESRKDGPFDCYVFHDVDLLPLNVHNRYRCTTRPMHLSAVVDNLGNKLPYWDIFGGASALTEEQMKRINGFSNVFWDWGAEDDDAAQRLKRENMFIRRYPIELGKYHMLDHEKYRNGTSKNFMKLFGSKRRFKTDGLNSLDYKVVDKIKEALFTKISVRL